MAEEKIGVVRSRLKGNDFDLFFTSTSIVAAKTGSISMWGLLLGGIGQAIAMHFSNKKSQQIRDLTIESLITSDKKNFIVIYENISRVELKKPGGLSAGKLIIDADLQKYKFLLLEKKQFKNNKEIIEKTLGEKVTHL
jgi:hypothetical protein